MARSERNPAFNPSWSPQSVFQRLDQPGAPIDRIFAEADDTRLPPNGLPLLGNSSGSMTTSFGRGSRKRLGGDPGRHPADSK